MSKKPEQNFHVDASNKPFYADTVSVLHNENQFILDFKQTTPRMDVVHGEQKLNFVTMHDTVVLNPVMARSMLDVLKDSIEKYEKQFSKIKMPKKQEKKKEVVDKTASSYIG